ncbi:MAG: DUF6340 family protein [Candidatus Delongbacteria bacterium]|jgi:tetratricopeptide (TPR) repeat protein|nr:DUF6340 family protein [Candidatus Delongbacteria bacterium]
MKASFLSILILYMLFLTSCNTTSVMVDVMEPAAINVPQDYKDVLIINRSLPGDDKHVENVVEGLLTNEAVFADRLGSENCVISMNETLNQNERFRSHLCEDCDFRGTGTGEWPVPLLWDSIKSVCDRYRADALVSLELFDTDKHINHSAETRTRTRNGETIRYQRHKAILWMEIRTGLRIYDPHNETIVHQQEFYDELSWEKKADSRGRAESRLPSHRKAAEEAGIFAGQKLASYISPTWKTTKRYVYVRGNEAMKSTKSLVKDGKWKEAAAIWKQYTDSKDEILAARANYNMAVAAEIQGNIEAAIGWAKQSLELNDSPRTRSYLSLLHKRKQDFRKLEEQLQE